MNLMDDMYAAAAADKQGAPPYVSLLKQANYVAALPLLKKAVNKADQNAMGLLGALYLMGLGVARDAVEGARLVRESAERGHVISQAALGLCLASGIGVEKNQDEASYWLFQASKENILPAMDALTSMVMRDHSLVDKYYTEDDLIDIARRAGDMIKKQLAEERAANPTLH